MSGLCINQHPCLQFRYPIYGGMQDWNYIHGGCFELTLEISDTKWPKAAEVSLHPVIYGSACVVADFFFSIVYSNILLQLPVIWEHNRMSMLNLLASLIKVICFHSNQLFPYALQRVTFALIEIKWIN